MKQKERDQIEEKKRKKKGGEFDLDALVHFIRNGEMWVPETAWNWQLPEKQVGHLVENAREGRIFKIHSFS